jgi:ribosome biogenesis GTPase A
MSISTESRPAKIQGIIESRKPITEKTANTVKQLNAVKSSLESFDNFLSFVIKKDALDEDVAKVDKLRSVLKRIVDTDILNRYTELTNLERRFSRTTLNIGVVGNARQGKSTFLQKLTGLSNDEIPSAADGHCTGAPSIVINDFDTYADIEFYTENEFMEGL